MKFDLGIKGRIYGGFGLFVAVGLALALFGSWHLNWIEIAIGKMSATSNGSRRIMEISRDLEIMRRAALGIKLEDEEVREVNASASEVENDE